MVRPALRAAIASMASHTGRAGARPSAPSTLHGKFDAASRKALLFLTNHGGERRNRHRTPNDWSDSPRHASTCPRYAPLLPNGAPCMPRATSITPSAASSRPMRAAAVQLAAAIIPQAASNLPLPASGIPALASRIPNTASVIPHIWDKEALRGIAEAHSRRSEAVCGSREALQWPREAGGGIVAAAIGRQEACRGMAEAIIGRVGVVSGTAEAASELSSTRGGVARERRRRWPDSGTLRRLGPGTRRPRSEPGQWSPAPAAAPRRVAGRDRNRAAEAARRGRRWLGGRKGET